MIALLNPTGNDAIEKIIAHEGQQTRPERDIYVDYYAVRDEEDPFADKANLYPLDQSQQKAVYSEIEKVLHEAASNGL